MMDKKRKFSEIIGVLLFGLMVTGVLTFVHWGLGVLSIALTIWLLNVLRNEEPARAKAIAEQAACAIDQVGIGEGQTLAVRAALATYSKESETRYARVVQRLEEANALIDKAEVDFNEGAFAPFWDSIEASAVGIGHLEESIVRLERNLYLHADYANHFGVEPEVPMSVRSLDSSDVVIAAVARLESLVVKAQRNYQFATIYEQRKTNKILVAGFSSLGEALTSLSEKMQISIQGLHEQVRAFQTQVSHSDRNRSAREEEALEMLDNIQRGRRPQD